MAGRFYTRAELDNSPSRRSGLDAKKETQFRWAACDLIKEAGMRLKMCGRVLCARVRAAARRVVRFVARADAKPPAARPRAARS
jgi:hypothetical protein